MSERGHEIAATTLAVLGVCLILAAGVAELVGAIRGQSYEIPHAVYYVGAVIGFVGFYGKDPKRAKDGGSFIVDSAVRIIGVIRSGRRSTDVKAIVEPVETKGPGE